MVNLNPLKSEWAPILYKHGVCHRCAGEGTVAPFPHVEGGICFKCLGNRFVVEKKSHDPIMNLWKKNVKAGRKHSFQEITVLYEFFARKKKSPEYISNCPICGTSEMSIKDIAFGCCSPCFAELKEEG